MNKKIMLIIYFMMGLGILGYDNLEIRNTNSSINFEKDLKRFSKLEFGNILSDFTIIESGYIIDGKKIMIKDINNLVYGYLSGTNIFYYEGKYRGIKLKTYVYFPVENDKRQLIFTSEIIDYDTNRKDAVIPFFHFISEKDGVINKIDNCYNNDKNYFIFEDCDTSLNITTEGEKRERNYRKDEKNDKYVIGQGLYFYPKTVKNENGVSNFRFLISDNKKNNEEKISQEDVANWWQLWINSTINAESDIYKNCAVNLKLSYINDIEKNNQNVTIDGVNCEFYAFIKMNKYEEGLVLLDYQKNKPNMSIIEKAKYVINCCRYVKSTGNLSYFRSISKYLMNNYLEEIIDTKEKMNEKEKRYCYNSIKEFMDISDFFIEEPFLAKYKNYLVKLKEEIPNDKLEISLPEYLNIKGEASSEKVDDLLNKNEENILELLYYSLTTNDKKVLKKISDRIDGYSLENDKLVPEVVKKEDGDRRYIKSSNTGLINALYILMKGRVNEWKD